LCRACREDASALDGVRAACRFEGLVRQSIHDLKYRRARVRAPLLAELLERTLAARPLHIDFLIPVPLAPGRRRERGFNQSELVARALSERIGVPVDGQGLNRVRDTPRQVGRTVDEREQNVAGAFECASRESVRGQRIALVDDVMTTGATLRACAATLRAAGAERVYGLVVAREV
jgi:ComF family protein